MIDKTKEENIIILFDEQGTPTFGNRETDFFLGIGIAYKIDYEVKMFNDFRDDFGLTKNKPLKNDKINSKRALKISTTLSQLNMDILVARINLSNTELQHVVTLYEGFGNKLRKIHRNVRERPAAHILHKEIFDFVIYNIVNKYIERYPYPTRFSIYLDDWPFPLNDISIELETSSRIFEQRINEINEQYFPKAKVKIDKYKLLKGDLSKERFIDVIASIISRKYLAKNHPKYFLDAKLDAKINETDITDSTIKYIKMYMDKLSRVS